MNDFTFFASVIGYGRFGKLWTTLLSSYISSHNLTCRIGVVDSATITNDLPKDAQVVSLEEILKESDTIFLCVPISQVKLLLENIAPQLDKNTLICDTCSVKMKVVTWMKDILPASQPIMATHPLFGPDSYRISTHNSCTNTENKHTIITHPVAIDSSRYEYWRKIFSHMNLSSIELSPKEHDQQAAYSQCLTHLLGRTLKKLSLSKTAVSTKGYEALLEIVEQTCSDTITLFKDMYIYNTFSEKMQKDFLYVLHETMKEVTSDYK